MTFILGIRCDNGLVMAADSQEGDGFVKKNVNKLEIFQGVEWGVCWGGAGHSRVADKFSDKFKQSLRSATGYDRNNIEAVAEACLQFVHEKYSEKAGDIEIVLGCFGFKGSNLEWYLYKGGSRESCLSIQKGFCCAGTGDNSLANFILGNVSLWSGPVTVVRVFQATQLAVSTVSLMKEYADGVGGPTRILTFTNPVVQWFPVLPYKIAEIERELPISEIETAISDYWYNKHDFRKWMDEVNQEEIRTKKLAAQKSKRAR